MDKKKIGIIGLSVAGLLVLVLIFNGIFSNAKNDKNLLSGNNFTLNNPSITFDNVSFDSWMDYFIMGDVYILGQGFDFSEFDLWWLLLRRKREKANTGKIVYYEPEYRNKYKLLALKALDVDTVSFGQAIDETKDKNKQFREFYIKAIDDIKEKVNTLIKPS